MHFFLVISMNYFFNNNVNNKKEKIITNRLILRKLRREDAESMFKNWDSDPEVAKYTIK